MAQEEQIKQYLNERNIPTDSLEANSIMEGINWADKNTKETNGKELLYVANKTAERTKKEVIDKLCEWFEDVDFETTYIDSEGLFDKEQFINDFRKAYVLRKY